MVENANLIKVGNSLGVILDKRVLKKVFHWDEETKLDINYDAPNKIVIKKVGDI